MIKNKVKIFFNKHTKEAIEKRGSINNMKFNLYLGLESRPGSDFHLVKPFLRSGNDIFPCRIFNNEDITYIKVLTFLDEYRFFVSANLNFGTNYFVKKLDNFEIVHKESFFDKNDDPIIKIKWEDVNWEYRVKKIDKIKGKSVSMKNRDNLVIQKFGLPLLVKTFSGNFIALSN